MFLLLFFIYSIGYQSSDYEYALDASVHAFNYFQEYLHEPYPLSTLQILLSPNFAPAAMENFGLIICRKEYLLIEEGANQDLQRRVAYVLSHEIAHQWFGNLVTNRDWSHVYIQEGLATFLGYMIHSFISLLEISVLKMVILNYKSWMLFQFKIFKLIMNMIYITSVYLLNQQV